MSNDDPSRGRPSDASLTVLMATGDEGRATDRVPAFLQSALTSHGIAVRGIECVGGDLGTRDARLAAQLIQASSDVHGRLVLAGLSRGARVSAGLVERLDAIAYVALAYPFHARTDPSPYGLPALRKVGVPSLLCQGTRDSHGNRQQVAGYDLPGNIAVHWLEDANHALVPRPSSGRSQAEQLAEVATRIIGFLRLL